jgi:type II secretion system protein N
MYTSAYLTFPSDAVSHRLGYEIQKASGGALLAEFENLLPSGLLGLKDDRVELTVRRGAEAVKVVITDFDIGVAWLRLLTGRAAAEVNGVVGGGRVAGEVEVGAGGVTLASVLEGVDLEAFAPLLGRLPIPVQANITGHVRYDAAADPQQSQGQARLSVSGLSVGPGKLQAGAMGDFEIPQAVRFGSVEVVAALDKGRLEVKEFKQQSATDVQIAALTGSLTLRPRMETSNFDACIAVGLNETFSSENPKFKTILDLATIGPPAGPGFRKDDSGRLHVAFAGTLRGGLRPQRKQCE